MAIKKPVSYNRIPKSVELFGREITTSMEDTLDGMYGEARYGVNVIAVNPKVKGKPMKDDEIKVTYLHEMLHFILNFAGIQQDIVEGNKVDIETLVDLVAVGIYEYEKTAKY
jgi:hypothetical protein